MGKIITRIKDWLRGVPLGAVGRSSQWGSVRKAFLVNNPEDVIIDSIIWKQKIKSRP